jgi:hypothetical protein
LLIGIQLEQCYEEQRLPLFQGSYQDKLKTSQHHDFLKSLPEGSSCEIFPSNQVVYKYPTKYTWGEMISTHSIGSYYCPSFCNRVVLYHCVNGAMDYSIWCCDGKENMQDAQEILDLFYEFMEHSVKVTKYTNVMDLVNSSIK